MFTADGPALAAALIFIGIGIGLPLGGLIGLHHANKTLDGLIRRERAK